MADKRCENGHYIDESWDICPYCPQAESEEVPVVQPSRSRQEPPAARRPAAAPAAPAARPVSSPAVTPAKPASVESDPPGVERTVVVRVGEIELPVTRRYVVGWLVGLNGAVRGESFPVRMGRNVLGRDRRSDIVVNDDQASSHHADLVFRPEEARFILMDHNSTNGTYVNEAEIEPRRDLGPDDVVRIGGHRFLFVPLCSEIRMWDSEGDLR